MTPVHHGALSYSAEVSNLYSNNLDGCISLYTVKPEDSFTPPVSAAVTLTNVLNIY